MKMEMGISNIKLNVKYLLTFFVLIYSLLLPNLPSGKIGDDLFHLAVGEYIFYHGFPNKDMFSMHNLNYITHEWLSEVIFFMVNKIFGYLGSYYFLTIWKFIVFAVMLHINIYLAKAKNLKYALITILQSCMIGMMFFQNRPQIFSILIFIIEYYILERSMREKSVKILYYLPLLALLLANFHGGTIPFFVILFLPYLLELNPNLWEIKLYINISKIRIAKTEDYSLFVKLLNIAVLSVAATCVNPYGYHILGYPFMMIFSDYTYAISEWEIASLRSVTGVCLYPYLIFTLFYMMITKRQVHTRHIAFFGILLCMSLTSAKYLIFVPVFGVFSIFSIIGESEIDSDERGKLFNTFTGVTFKRVEYVFYGLVFAVVLNIVIYNNKFYIKMDEYPVKAVDYLLKNTDYKNIRVFNDYFSGNYLIKNGIKVFVDPRLDLYLPTFNKECMVIDDYFKVTSGRENYKNIINKYDIQYVIVRSNTVVATYMAGDNDFEKLIEDSQTVMFKRKDAVKCEVKPNGKLY